MKKISTWLITVGVALIAIVNYNFYKDPYYKEKNVNVKVLFKEDVFSNHKGRVEHNGYKLVCLYKEQRFELLVDLYTYKIAVEGGNLSFNLTDNDMGVVKKSGFMSRTFIVVGVLMFIIGLSGAFSKEWTT